METSLLSTRETSVPVMCLEIEHPAVGAGETSGTGQFGTKTGSGTWPVLG